MLDYIFTIGCFDKMHKGHIKLLESMKKHTKKIIIGLHDDDSIKKLKKIYDVDSFYNRKKNLEKYAHDIFIINDIDPTNCLQEYILKNFYQQEKEIKQTEIYCNINTGLNYNNFELYSTNFKNLIPHCDKNRNYSFWVYNRKEECTNIWDTVDPNICKTNKLIDDSNIKKKIYQCFCDKKCVKLPIGIRAKHFYQDDKYIIYNERDYNGNLFKSNGNGRLIFKTNDSDYQPKIFDIHNNNTNNGGSEDYRYIVYKEDLYVIMNGLSKSNKRQMYLYNIKKNKICHLFIKNYDITDITQKNWISYIYKNELYFIYSFCELCVVKLKNDITGECELIFGNPLVFTNKTIFGGTNLCHWKNDLFIGFAHIRDPWYSVPIIFDAKNFKYISTKTPIKIQTPFKINLLNNKTVQYPYYMKKCEKNYELFVCHQDFYSIKYEISISKINNLFNNLFNNKFLLSINIGSSKSNSKVINSNYKGDLFFIHKFKDTFKYDYKDNNITITRTDSKSGWGQNLIGYKKNWCFMRADDNKNFPSIQYVKKIMAIKYLPYSMDISSTKLRDYKNNKVGLMNYLLQKVVNILNENNIPYYLDCGTLLGCIRDNELMKKDTDIDLTTHLSYWKRLNSINFNKYGLIRTRTYTGYPNKEYGNMISIKTKYSDLYCDIYTNPAFPKLDNKILNGKNYNIPLNSELYLTQLYGNWKVPSNNHATTKYHRGNGLVFSKYFEYWDKKFKIFKCKM